MNQHTPGPWIIQNDDTPWTEGDAELAVQYKEAFGPTEILFSIRGGELGDDKTITRCPWEPLAGMQVQAELRANARLIAKAPEMYGLLKELGFPINETLAPTGLAHKARALLRGIEEKQP